MRPLFHWKGAFLFKYRYVNEKCKLRGTYQVFITAINEIGKEYKEQIYREFLGIEPPSDLGQGKLQ